MPGNRRTGNKTIPLCGPNARACINEALLDHNEQVPQKLSDLILYKLTLAYIFLITNESFYFERSVSLSGYRWMTLLACMPELITRLLFCIDFSKAMRKK